MRSSDADQETGGIPFERPHTSALWVHSEKSNKTFSMPLNLNTKNLFKFFFCKFDICSLQRLVVQRRWCQHVISLGYVSVRVSVRIRSASLFRVMSRAQGAAHSASIQPGLCEINLPLLGRGVKPAWPEQLNSLLAAWQCYAATLLLPKHHNTVTEPLTTTTALSKQVPHHLNLYRHENVVGYISRRYVTSYGAQSITICL